MRYLVVLLTLLLPACAFAQYAPYVVSAVMSSPWPAMEQRCQDLGADCWCSEPLDDNISIPTSSPLDPANTTTTDKECWGVGGTGDPDDDTIGYTTDQEPIWLLTSAMTGSPYNFPAFPTGTSVVNRILADDVPGQLAVKQDYGMTFHDQTICRRHYVVLHETYEHDYSGGDRIKMSRVNNSGTPALYYESEFQWGSPGTSATFRIWTQDSPEWGAFTNNNWNPGIDLGEFRDRWWRKEVCFDHDATGTSDKLEMRSRLVDLSTGTTYTAPVKVSANAIATGGQLGGTSANWIIDGFRQTNGSKVAPGMWSGFSAAMVVRMDFDDTFWIGCAEEIEGAGC